MQELPIPPDAYTSEQAIEVARGWIVDNKLQCSLLPSIWAETPEVWGMLLADFAAHISKALAKESDMTRAQIHRIITKRLMDEIASPTSHHPGDFVDRDEEH